ncbi:MAG TPA: flavoprotein [Thermoanaerobaculia bacterium]|nr:flavoprotein [Thermoanaerobaculia bacterium]
MEQTIRAKRILLCAAGGYQSYALPGFVLSLLHHLADDVQVVLSRAASKLASRYAVEVASRHPVFVEMEDTGEGIYVPHIELGRDVDAILVFPATVNIIGKVAQGIADELIAALILATKAPVFFVPVTNAAMWSHPAVQRNVDTLRRDGYVILPPLPIVEVATREGLDEIHDVFALPTLLAQVSAVLRGTSSAGVVRR